MVKLNLIAREIYTPIIPLIGTRHDFHKRRFTGSIFSYHGMNFARVELDGDIVQRQHAWEFLGDVLNFENGLTHILFAFGHQLFLSSSLSEK